MKFPGLNRATLATIFWTAFNGVFVHSHYPISFDGDAKYEVVIRKTDERENVDYIWAGVILSTQFVLSADAFEGKKDYDEKGISVIVGYNIVGEVKEKKKYFGELEEAQRVLENKGIYEIDKFWRLDSLLLMRTNNLIQFNSQIRSVILPKGNILNQWKNPFFIPQNKDFTISYWCRNQHSKDYRLRFTKQVRKCNKKVCYRGDGTVPACMSIQIYGHACLFPPGAPLIYDDTLVGIRKEPKRSGPMSVASDGYFINIAYYYEAIKAHIHQDATSSGNLQQMP